MNSKYKLEKKRKTFNMLGIVLGLGGFVLVVYFWVVLYDRGIYADEHHISGYITGIETAMIVSIPVLWVASIICFKVAQSNALHK